MEEVEIIFRGMYTNVCCSQFHPCHCLRRDISSPPSPATEAEKNPSIIIMDQKLKKLNSEREIVLLFVIPGSSNVGVDHKLSLWTI